MRTCYHARGECDALPLLHPGKVNARLRPQCVVQ
jgi:hypothetical protein